MRRLVALLVVLVIGSGTPSPTAWADPGDGPGVGQERRGLEGRRRGGQARDARLLEMVRRTDPGRHAKLVQLRDARPRLYRSLVLQAAQNLRHRAIDERAIPRFQETVDASYTLHEQLDAWIAADDKARRALRPEIEATVATLFELRQEARRVQLQVLEQRLERLRGEIDQRDQNKKELVDGFTVEMLDKVDGGPGF
jgi:hypothetical protein